MNGKHLNGSFQISDYLDFIGKEQKRGKYKCPNCGEYKLSIAKDGKKFNCWSCGDTKAISYHLMSMAKSQNISYTQTHQENIEVNENKNSKSLWRLCIDIKNLFKDLRYNEHTCKIWLGDKPFDDCICPPELAYIYLSQNYGIESSKDKVQDILLHLAMKKPFNPLLEYFEKQRFDFYSLSKKQGATIDQILHKADILLSNVAKNYFNDSTPIYNLYLRNWLLGAVGRAYREGCYNRNVLILQGDQNIGKSSFFSILGGEWFSDSLGEGKHKDELMIAHSNWILEWQELETIWGKREVGRIKAFISASKDNVRLPYGRSVKELKRKFVFCGTTNEDRFLTDKTGNSRFWVIPVKEIDLTKWENDRNKILGAASTLIHYWDTVDENLIRTGKLWALKPDEIKLSQTNTIRFEEEHPYEEFIDELIETWDNGNSGAGCIMNEKIWTVLDIPIKERPKHYNQLGQLMKKKGYISKTKRIDGQPKRIWVRKESN